MTRMTFFSYFLTPRFFSSVTAKRLVSYAGDEGDENEGDDDEDSDEFTDFGIEVSYSGY